MQSHLPNLLIPVWVVGSMGFRSKRCLFISLDSSSYSISLLPFCSQKRPDLNSIQPITVFDRNVAIVVQYDLNQGFIRTTRKNQLIVLSLNDEDLWLECMNPSDVEVLLLHALCSREQQFDSFPFSHIDYSMYI
ncbi:hypothetical protein GEMRC1_006945 [Eukaryota sp. GEM-RC1]